MELAKVPSEVATYIDDVKAEMNRVTWPSWHQVRATTAVVIAAVFLFAAYFFMVDAAVSGLINAAIHRFTR